jgi:hypothetical protein
MRRDHDTYLTGLGYADGDRLKLRRFASGTTHHAQQTPPRFYRVTILGADCLMAIDMPVTAACGAVLQGGEVIAMEAKTKVGCVACRQAVTP